MNPPETIIAIEPTLFVAAMAVLGLMIGSFLNVVIYRLPRMMEREWRNECHALLGVDQAPQPAEPAFDLMRPRSRCPSCNQLIAAFDNVPVLSYLFLRGRCRHCGTGISARYPITEAFTGLASGYAAWHFGAGSAGLSLPVIAQCLAAAVLLWYLIALALIDIDTKLLPDSLTLPLLWFGLGCSFFGWFAPTLESAVVGAMCGYLSLWSIYWVFKLVTGKEGMGYGDFKLLAALAAWFGWQTLPALILVSSIVGAVVGIALMVGGRHRRAEPLPFGPYLALAGMIVLFWNDAIQRLISPAGVL